MSQRNLITVKFGAAHDEIIIHLDSGDQIVDLSKVKLRAPTILRQPHEEDEQFRRRASEAWSLAKRSYAKERRQATGMVTEFWAKSNGIAYFGREQLDG